MVFTADYFKKVTFVFFSHTNTDRQYFSQYNLFINLLSPKYEKYKNQKHNLGIVDTIFDVHIDRIFEKDCTISTTFWRKIFSFLKKHNYTENLNSLIIPESEIDLWNSLKDDPNLLVNGLYFLFSKKSEKHKILYYLVDEILYQEKESLNITERQLIKTIRQKKPKCIENLVFMYAELPHYLQESIFAELKGMHMGYMAAKAKSQKENV